MSDHPKQKPALAIRLPDPLEAHLRAKAAEAHRTITAEIRMRLEWSCKHEQPAGTVMPQVVTQ
jgi:plasmid stability protein